MDANRVDEAEYLADLIGVICRLNICHRNVLRRECANVLGSRVISKTFYHFLLHIAGLVEELPVYGDSDALISYCGSLNSLVKDSLGSPYLRGHITMGYSAFEVFMEKYSDGF